MDASKPVSLRLPKYHAILDYGHGLYKGFEIHTHRLAEIVPRLQHATLLLADGEKFEIVNGTLTASEPYPAQQDLRFVWTPI